MAKQEIPEKLYYSISEVKQITGIEPYVLRFWEAEFPTLKPRKNKKGHRTYRRKDIEHILRIKELLYENKYTIPGAREVLASRKHAPGREARVTAAPPAAAAEEIQSGGSDDTELLERIRLQLTDLAALLDKEKVDDIFAD
jgi:DNA-binding transcriptional MerR regulator